MKITKLERGRGFQAALGGRPAKINVGTGSTDEISVRDVIATRIERDTCRACKLRPAAREGALSACSFWTSVGVAGSVRPRRSLRSPSVTSSPSLPTTVRVQSASRPRPPVRQHPERLPAGDCSVVLPRMVRGVHYRAASDLRWSYSSPGRPGIGNRAAPRGP